MRVIATFCTHEHQIAGIATQLKEVMTPEFKAYIQQVKKNAVALSDTLKSKGYSIATDGTENHLILWDLRPQGITGSKIEKVCDAAHMTLNKNCVPGDRSAASPGGVRIGTPAMTTRGLVEADMVQIGEFLHRACEIGVKLQVGRKKLVDFVPAMEGNEEIEALASEVKAFATTFAMPGFEVSSMKYNTI